LSKLSSFLKVRETGDEAGQLKEALLNTIRAKGDAYVGSATIKPSKANCPRQMNYILRSVKGKNSSLTAEMKMIQQSGSLMHEVLQSYLLEAEPFGVTFHDPRDIVAEAQAKGLNTRPNPCERDSKYEIRCYNEDYNVSFMFDGGITIGKTGTKAILEIKTEDHFKWTKRFGVDPAHIDQVIWYSIALGIDEVFFIYQNRNYKTLKTYQITITDEQRAEVIAKALKVLDEAKECILSEKVEGKHCQYCNFKALCKANKAE